MAWGSLTGCFGWQPTELWRTREAHTRIWLYCWKFILVIPAALGAWAHWMNWQEVERYEELQMWPYNVHGDMGAAWWWGYVALVSIAPWTFLSIALIKAMRGRWLFLWGFIDLGLALFACYGLYLQDRFLPNHYLACSGDKATKWQVVDGHDSLFKVISVLEGGTNNPKKICKVLVGNWTLGVTIVTIQFIIAYIGIFSDESAYSLLNAYRPAYWLLCLIITPVIWTRDALLPWVRFSVSRFKKSLFRLRKSKDLEIPELKQYKASYRQFSMPKSKLMDVLFIEHLLLNVVNNMHYEDVVNLSLTCHAAREAVYPRNDLAMRIPKLKETCCQYGDRKACLYCNKLICLWCRRRLVAPALPGRRHTTKCRPYCRTCYYAALSQHRSGYKRPCKGHGDKALKEEQETCASCADNYSDGMRARRKRRFQQLARDIAFGRVPAVKNTKREGGIGMGDGSRQDDGAGDGSSDGHVVEESVQRDKPVDGRHCGLCKADLKSGMRWWVCGVCGGECRDSIHPSFVRRREMWDADIEKMSSEDARAAAEQQVRWWRRWLRK